MPKNTWGAGRGSLFRVCGARKPTTRDVPHWRRLGGLAWRRAWFAENRKKPDVMARDRCFQAKIWRPKTSGGARRWDSLFRMRKEWRR